MIKFEEHDGMLFKMLEEPVPLTKDAKMPCIIAPIQDDSPMGRYVKQCWGHNEIFMRGKYAICGINADMVKVGFARETPLSIHMFEIIGTFVKEGSAEWALYQMMKGKKVMNIEWIKRKSKDLKYCYCENGMLVYNPEYVLAKPIPIGDFLAPLLGLVAISDGWQIYEPKEKPQYKVGDWVECAAPEVQDEREEECQAK